MRHAVIAVSLIKIKCLSVNFLNPLRRPPPPPPKFNIVFDPRHFFSTLDPRLSAKYSPILGSRALTLIDGN